MKFGNFFVYGVPPWSAIYDIKSYNMENDLQPRFYPDLSKYSEILCPDGQPINDVNFVIQNRQEVASMLGQNVINNDNFLPPLDNISEDDAFNSFVPKGIQTTDEITDYMDYLNSQIYDKNKK